MGDEEKLSLSKDYKRAFNDADMIITQFPKLVKTLKVPEGEKSEYSKGFQDRLRQFEMEKDAMKGFSPDQLKAKYRKDINPSINKDSLDREN